MEASDGGGDHHQQNGTPPPEGALEALQEATLTDLKDNPVSFTSLYEQAYVQRAEEFRALNTNVVFVGHGGKKKGLKYVDMLEMEGRVPLYTDPKRTTHRALDLTDLSWKKLLSDSKGYALSKEASKQGFKVAVIGTGSHTQLGGVALISKENGIEFFHKCHTTYDYPEVDDMLALCKAHKE